MLRFLALGAVVGAASSVVGDTAAQIAVLAAGAAGAGYLFRNIVVPLAKILRRTLTAWEILEGLHDWCVGVDHRLRSLEAHMSATREPVEAIARDLDVHHRAPDPPGPPEV